MSNQASQTRIEVKANYRIMDVRLYKGKQAESLDPTEDEKFIVESDAPFVHVRIKTNVVLSLLALGGMGINIWRWFF